MLFPSSLGKRLNKKVLLVGLRILLAGIIALLLQQVKLDWLEFPLYDLRAKFSPKGEISQNVELVLVSSNSVQEMRGLPTAKDLQITINRIQQHKPKYIALTFNPEDIAGSDEEKRQFSEQLRQYPNISFTRDDLTMKGEEDLMRMPAPFELAPVSSAPKTADTKIYGKDGVTRRMLISFQDQWMLHPLIASQYNSDLKFIEKINGLFDFAGSRQIYIHFWPTGSFNSYDFSDIFFNRKEGSFNNKIVILGTDLGKTSQSYIQTPLSNDIKAMTIAEMHANMFETLIQNKGVQKVSNWIHFLLIFAIAILTIHVVLALDPSTGLSILVGTFTGYTLLSWICFWGAGLWLPMAGPLLTIFLCYYFFIPYRLIVENRKSWEYQQKNKLLQQVEELKTNFISMMSHDLKTPIARIHGMTDIILKESAVLTLPQRDAVDTIKHSADDLLKFINAILAYGRIEAESIQLQLRGKDINILVEDVVKKHEFLAKLKRIQLIVELEPLFPILIDPDLIKQVLSNLVENAIKYSPEDTKVLITSEEQNGKIVIQVSDQGPGIPADDLPNIFMKFYRCKNAKTSPIKGSGLGLYLAKYFIELHNGAISVESEPNQGSTFTIEIPNNLEGKNA